MCRSSSGSEIYDLAWSPDGSFFITGSMDNVARIYSATNGKLARVTLNSSHHLTRHRKYRATDRRAQPLRTRCCVGPSQRVCRNTILGQIGTHLYTQDKRRPIQPDSAQQSHQNGSTSSPHFIKQPGASRSWPRQPPSSLRTGRIPRSDWLTCTISSWNTTVVGFAYEPTANITQPPILFWITNGRWPFSSQAIRIAQPVHAAACGHAICLSERFW